MKEIRLSKRQFTPCPVHIGYAGDGGLETVRIRAAADELPEEGWFFLQVCAPDGTRYSVALEREREGGETTFLWPITKRDTAVAGVVTFRLTCEAVGETRYASEAGYARVSRVLLGAGAARTGVQAAPAPANVEAETAQPSTIAHVSVTGRAISVPETVAEIAVAGDAKARRVVFDVSPRFYDGVDLGEKYLYVELLTPDGRYDIISPQVEMEETMLRLIWTVEKRHAQHAGNVSVRLRASDADGYIYQTHTATFTVRQTFAQAQAVPDDQLTAVETVLGKLEAALGSTAGVTGGGASGIERNEQYTGAVLTIIDDDGHIKFLQEHVPLYRRYGVRPSFAVVASRAERPVGTTTSGDPYEAMDWTQIRELTKDGFDMLSHTYSHKRTVFNPYDNAGVTATQVDEEFGRADALFRENGLSYSCMVYPWGRGTELNQRCARKYVQYAVNLSGGDGLNQTETVNPLDIGRYDVNDAATTARAKALIDRAIAENAWLILCTHAGSDWPPVDEMDGLLAYAVKSGIRIETFTDAARLKAPRVNVGVGDTALRVLPDGQVRAVLDELSIFRLMVRAGDRGFIPSLRQPEGYIAAPCITCLGALDTGRAAYIDTGYIPTANTRIEITARLYGNGALFGARNADNTNAFYLYNAKDNPSFATFGASSVAGGIADTNLHVIQMDATGVTLDGTQLGAFAAGQQIAQTRSLLLFNRNEETVSGGRNISASVYGVKLYESDTLSMDLRPAFDEVSGGPCLYDVVGGRTLYPSDAAGFTTGQEVIQATDFSVDAAFVAALKTLEVGSGASGAVSYIPAEASNGLTIDWTCEPEGALSVRMSGKALTVTALKAGEAVLTGTLAGGAAHSYSVTVTAAAVEDEVTYCKALRSSGGLSKAAYFDTGYTPKALTRVVMDVSQWADGAAFGARDTAGDNAFYYYNTLTQINANFARFGASALSGQLESRRMLLAMDASGVTADGERVGTFASGQSVNPGCSMYIFNLNAGGSVGSGRNCGMTLFDAKIYEGETLIMHLRPAVLNGAPVLYDTVGKRSLRASEESFFTAVTEGEPAGDAQWDLTGNVGYVPLASYGEKYTLYMELGGVQGATPAEASENLACIVTSKSNVEQAGYGVATVGLTNKGVSVVRYQFYSHSLGSSEEVRTGAPRKAVTDPYAPTVSGLPATQMETDGRILINSAGLYRPESGVARRLFTDYTGTVSAHHGYLYIGSTASNYEGKDKALEAYTTGAALEAGLDAGEIHAAVSGVSIKSLIFYANTDYTTRAEVIANRESAEVDIQFDEKGEPYNAGTSGALIYTKR